MFFFKHRVARPYELLLISGNRNKNIKLEKKAWIWPGQTCTTLNTGLTTWTFQAKATSSDNLPYLVHTLLAIGPWTHDEASMQNYAKTVSQSKKKRFPYDEVKKIVSDTMEESIHALAASMTCEEISKATKEFEAIVDKAQLQLSKFGLFVYFAYVNNHLVYTREKMETIGLSQADFGDYRFEIGKRYTKEQEADAELYRRQKAADSDLYWKQKAADALLYGQKKEAERIMAEGEAQELYIARLLESFGGNYGDLRKYLLSNVTK